MNSCHFKYMKVGLVVKGAGWTGLENEVPNSERAISDTENFLNTALPMYLKHDWKGTTSGVYGRLFL